jgi:predicted dienelactone hydrolase
MLSIVGYVEVTSKEHEESSYFARGNRKMRSGELLLIAALSSTTLAGIWNDKRQATYRLTGLCATLLLLVWHLVEEGSRWQMVPAYCLSIGLCVRLAWTSVASRRRSAPIRWRSRTRQLLLTTLACVAISLAIAPLILVPHLRLPDPSGPHAIGTLNLDFVDASRPETFTANPHDFRRLFARVWYPAEAVTDRLPVSYAENASGISQALTGPTPLPSFFFEHLALTRTHAYRDASPIHTNKPFPIVVFSHAYWGSVSQCTVLMEDLASHGYVAISLGHPFETPYAIHGDGSIQGFDPHNKEFQLRGIERRQAMDLEQQLTQTTDLDLLRSLLDRVTQQRPKTLESLQIWSKDISSLLDELERIDAGQGPLAARLDLSHVAVMGHSFGGTAAGQACMDDQRCKVGVNVDGLQLGTMVHKPVRRPFLFLHHDNSNARNKTPNLYVFQQAAAPSYLATVTGTGHLSFTDVVLYGRASLFHLLSPVGEIDGVRAQRILCDCVREFLDRHLRQRENDFPDDLTQRYPELQIRQRFPAEPGLGNGGTPECGAWTEATSDRSTNITGPPSGTLDRSEPSRRIVDF